MHRNARAIRPARLIVPAAIAAAALLFTACSGGDTGKQEAEEGPLSKYMSALYDDEEYTQDMFDKQQLQTEELVAACMTKEGFEYTPNTNNGGMALATASDEDPEGPEWGTEEFAKQYGYGIINWPGQEEANNQPEEEYSDPNEGYVNSLSESEMAAYYEALHGPQPSEEELLATEEEGGTFEYNWETAGCYGAAQHEVQENMNAYQAASEDPQFADLFESMNEVWTTLYDETNPHEEAAKLSREWADCMADAGFSEFTSPNAAQQTLYDEYNELQMPEGEEGEYQEPTEDDKKKFQEREIEVAVADTVCKKQVDFDDQLVKLQFDLEQTFVDEHKAELDAMVAQYGTKSKQKD